MEIRTVKKGLGQFKKKLVLVIGDLMLDQYTFGEVSRISPEGPVPILRKIDEKFVPGGAGNVANNLVSLGAKVVLCGVVGNDHYKDKLLDILSEQGIETRAVLVHKKRPTILKHRFVAGNSHQLLRVDDEITDNLETEEEQQLFERIEKEIKKVNIIILSDYAKGLFSRSFTQQIIKLAKRQNKRVLADIKPKNKDYFMGVDVITPNRKEAQEMAGTENVNEAGKQLVSYFGADVLITKSDEGMSIFEKNGKNKEIPARKIKVFDVGGAGDTVMAVVALGLASNLSLEDAAWLANYAGEIVVQKPGTAVLTIEELVLAFKDQHHVEAVDIVTKLWGYEKWLENNEKYCSKILFVKKGYQCSLHYHKVKDEMFLLTKGHILLEIGKEIYHMRQGNFVRILPGISHRFRGIEDSEILEISTHHREDDSYRLEESRKVDEKAK